MKDIERMKRELEASLKDLENFLKSPAGQSSLKVLEAKFGGDVLGVDSNHTHVRIGEQRVLQYLQAIAKEK